MICAGCLLWSLTGPKQNIAKTRVSVDHSQLGTMIDVLASLGRLPARVVERPFHDPEMTLAAG